MAAAQAIGGSLQRVHVLDSQKGIVGCAEADTVSPQLLVDERVAVQEARDVEREARSLDP